MNRIHLAILFGMLMGSVITILVIMAIRIWREYVSRPKPKYWRGI